MSKIPMSNGEAFFLVFICAFLALLYFLPTIIAALRKSPKTGAVVILNLFLGFTFVGWIVALVLAFKQPDRVVYVYQQPLPPLPTR